MKAILPLLFLITISINSVFAQKVKFGKVDKTWLKQESCTYDQADAEYIYHSAKVQFEYNDTYGRFDLVYYIHDQIKIYTKEGVEYANFSIPYYIGGNSPDNENISNLKALTYNLVDGKTEVSKLSKKNIFDEELNQYYALKKFALPAVKKGSVIEIKYKLTSPRVFSVDEFYFQEDIPISNAFFEATIPEFYNYNVDIKGNVALNKEEERESRSFNMTTTVVGKDLPGSQTGRAQKQRVNVDVNVDIKRYTANNVPAIKNEPYVYTMNNYKSAVRMELLSTKFPNSKINYYTKDWNKVATLISKTSFGTALRKKYKDLDDLVEKVADLSEEEKIATIFNAFQSSFTWNGFYSIYPGDDMKKLMKEGTGNVAAINLLLVNILQKSGVQAFPLVYKTRKSGNLNISNPTIDNLDYVLAVVQLEKGLLYLDATSPNVSPNMLPSRALNLRGVVVNDDQGMLMPIQNPNRGSVTNYYTLKIEDGQLEGSFQGRIKGYEAYKERVRYEKEENFIEGMDESGVSYSDIEISDFYSNKNSVSVKASVQFQEGLRQIGDEYFIDLSLLHASFENPFTSEERNFPIFFESTSKVNSIVKIAIPEGYEIKSIPEKMLIASPEKQLQYLIEPKVQGAEIVLNIRETRNVTMIEPSYYSSVKQFYDQVQSKFQDKIILAKN